MFLTSFYLYEVMEKVALSLLETNNWQKNIQTFFVTLWQSQILRMVQNHRLGHNFFVYECIENPRYAQASVRNLWHLEA